MVFSILCTCSLLSYYHLFCCYDVFGGHRPIFFKDQGSQLPDLPYKAVKIYVVSVIFVVASCSHSPPNPQTCIPFLNPTLRRMESLERGKIPEEFCKVELIFLHKQFSQIQTIKLQWQVCSWVLRK